MRRRLLLGLAFILAVVATPAAAAQRLALVVGEAAYAAHPLATAAADAGLVAQALAQAGYEVTAARDLDGKRLRAALHAFADSARDAGPDATILVYLAGIGVQYDGNNYMVPVDAALAHDDDVPLQCADLDDFSRALATAPAKTHVLLLDLSRQSPLAAADEMPLAPGLALVSPSKDTLVGFAAAPGAIAPPAPLPYGAYARALAEALGPQKDDKDGLGASAMLERVRLRVATLTNGAQIPWNAGTLSGDAAPTSALDRLQSDARSPEVAFAAVLARDALDGYADFLRAVPDGPLAARVRVLLALRREATTWRAVEGSDDPRAAWTYMRLYPRGPHLFDARRRLAALKAQLEPPPRFDPVVFPEAPPPSEAELALVAHPHDAERGLPAMPAPPSALLPAAPAAYGDALPPPTPAPRDLLPITLPLPQDAAIEPGKITQTDADGSDTVTETYVAPNGASTLTLSDDNGALLTFATRTDKTGARVTVETGPKGGVKSRTTTTQVDSATTSVLADTAGATLMQIAARTDPDGSRTTRVTDGDGTLLAVWRRNAAGIVVASETAGAPLRPPPAAAAPPRAAPTSPTIAIPAVPKPPLHPTQPTAERHIETRTPAPAAPAAPATPKTSAPVSPQPPASVAGAPQTSKTDSKPAVQGPATPVAPKAAPAASPPKPAPTPPAAPAAKPAPPVATPPAAAPAPAAPRAPAPDSPPTPPPPSMRVPLPPPRPAAAKTKAKTKEPPRERKPAHKPGASKPVHAPRTKAHAKPAPRKASPAPHHKGKASR